MKIVFFILFVVVCQTFAITGNSQNAAINLSSNKMTINELFTEIEQQTEYLVVYSDTEINTETEISVNKKSAKVSDCLKEALTEAHLKYEFSNDYIIVSKAESGSVLAQQNGKKISGTVKDEMGESIIGANIVVKGSSINGTITDVDGNFSLEVPPGATIVVSYIGYQPQEIELKNKSYIDIKLIEDTQKLDEIVVVGYGVQKKVNLTGSVGTVKTKSVLKSRPVTNVQELFAGSIAGMRVTKSSGAVGSGASINIRGTSTIGSSSGVLVLIDGVPGNISTLNPNDIESVSVLKDAASASIYGSRAANGVILIMTKTSQKQDRPIIEVSTSVGIQNPQFMIDFVGSADYMKLYDQALINDGKSAIYGQQGLADLAADKYADVQWYKEIYDKNTLINNNYIALSGKEKSVSYRFSMSNDNQDGTIPNNKYNRITIKPDLTFNLLRNLTFRANLQYTYTKIQEPYNGTTGWQSEATRVSPITAVKEANGLYAVGSSMVGNPIAGVNEGGYSKANNKEIFGIFEATYTPIKNWNIKGSFAIYNYELQQKSKLNTFYLYDAEGKIAKTVNLTNNLKQTLMNSYRTMLQFTSDYTVSFAEKHNFKILGGFSQEYYNTDNFWASRQTFPFNNIDQMDLGNTNKQNGGNASDVAIQSYFARLNYDYEGKYLFEANIRADGSSRFAKGHRWGVFPSFSAGWNIQRESFMKSVEWLSEFKIRASWGVLGDAEKVGYYATSSVLAYNPSIYSFNDKLVGGAYNNVAVNKNISWESAEMTNVGIDLGFFNQKIKMTVDYFNNLRKDILYQAPVPSEFGLSAPYSNLLKMRNRGMEFSLGYNDKNGNFTYGIDLNASFSKNKALNLGGDEFWIEDNSITYLNGQYKLPYGYEADGFFQSEGDINNSASQGSNIFPGNIKFKDQNGDNVINGDDRVIINSKIPIDYGVNINLGYKNFDFLINMYGRLKTMRYISGYEGWAFYLTQNVRPMHLDSWTESNTDASYPRLSLQYTSNDSKYNSFWLRNADYLKIQNVQLGYTIPQNILHKVNIRYLRLYLSCQNLTTITDYDGFDPEGGYYPLSRTFSLGLNLNF